MAGKTTGWVKVATAGPTADGREIETQWLKDIAKTYDPQEYTANIFQEHWSWYGNFGQITAAKTEKDDKKRLCLFVKMIPNKKLIELNKAGQKLFTSIRVKPDFGGTGLAYLMHVAITDEPASLGTQQLSFSQNGEKNEIFINKEASEFDFEVTDELDDLVEEAAKNENFSKRFKKYFSKKNSPQQDDEPMSKAAIEKLEKLEGQMAEFKTVVEKIESGEVSAPSEESVEEFKSTIKSLEEKVVKLEKENQSFSSLKGEFDKLSKDFAEALKDASEVPQKATGESQETEFELF